MSVDDLLFHQALQLAKNGQIHDKIYLREWCTGEGACAVDHTDGKGGHWRTTTSVRAVDVILRLVEERDTAREAIAASLDSRLQAALNNTKAHLRSEFADAMNVLQKNLKDKTAAVEDSHGRAVEILLEAFDKKIIALEKQVEELTASLQWYVDNDDTYDMEANRPWLEGKRRAMELLEKVKRGILG